MQEVMMMMPILKRSRKRNDGDHECRWDPNRSILDWQDFEKSQLCYFFAQTFRLCYFLRFFSNYVMVIMNVGEIQTGPFLIGK